MANEFIKLTDNSPEVLRNLQKAIARGLRAIGETAEGYAKENITKFPAVDTGWLRKSITHIERDNAAYIGTNVEYGKWIELGTGIYASDGNGRKDPWAFQDEKGNWHLTRGVKPVHYLKRAAAEHSAEYKKLLEESIKNA